MFTIIAACSTTSSNDLELTPVTLTSETSTVTPRMIPTKNVTPAAIETPDFSLQRTKYQLTAVLDYPNRQLAVDETIIYTNKSKDSLSELILVVEPNLLDGVFTMTSLEWADGTPISGSIIEAHKLTLPLMEALEPHTSIQIHLVYNLTLPVTEGLLSFSDTQVNVAGWYPYVAPYTNDTGWIIHNPGRVGEYQVYELADFQVKIQVKDAPPEFMIAASSQATIDQNGYQFNVTNVRNFTWSGSNNYQMLEKYAGDIRVREFVFPYDLEAGQASLEATVQALNLYSELFGPYSHDSLTVVEASFEDGMEYDGLYFLGQEYFNSYQGKPDNYLTAISAHETAHQWWYAMITNDQAYDPWLDEAFCTYSELLFYQATHPEFENWWWQTRVEYFSPTGWVDSSIYDFKSFRPYVNSVYLRGALFLRDLRGQVGDEVFYSFLKDYFSFIHDQATQDELGLATPAVFWEMISQKTNLDLLQLKTQYFAQP